MSVYISRAILTVAAIVSLVLALTVHCDVPAHGAPAPLARTQRRACVDDWPVPGSEWVLEWTGPTCLWYGTIQPDGVIHYQPYRVPESPARYYGYCRRSMESDGLLIREYDGKVFLFEYRLHWDKLYRHWSSRDSHIILRRVR